MRSIPEGQVNLEANPSDVSRGVKVLLKTVRQPVLVLNADQDILIYNDSFSKFFQWNSGRAEMPARDAEFVLSSPQWDFFLDSLLTEKKAITDFPFLHSTPGFSRKCLLNADFENPGTPSEITYISFREPSFEFMKVDRIDKNFKNILAHAPAMICVLKGPDHTFDVANRRYLRFIQRRNIIGRTVGEVLPEAIKQGFIEILNDIYSSGKAYTGKEILFQSVSDKGAVRDQYVDLLYQPTRDADEKVDGIFVHAIDVTEKVAARKKMEQNKERLRILIDTMPAIVWMSNKDGSSSHLNKNWYKFTGQTKEEAAEWGWMNAVDPTHRETLESVCKVAHDTFGNFNISFRILHRSGDYRWVQNNGEPKFDSSGNFQGMIGTIMDVHQEKLREEEIREKEHRIRSMVEEATVATALYQVPDMRIELANDAMIELWGKDRSVVGKPLAEALPELEGQPFMDLLTKVYETGETYWGKEDRVDLMIDGEMQTGYFNFTYKPLRNEKGEIYGILNMATDISELLESRKLIQESESHFRQMADLMPEKVANTTPQGKFIYFNQNWLDYTGMTSEQLQQEGWAQFIHPDDRREYEERWQKSLETGRDFEMELRFLDRFGKYLWHLSRAEAIKDDKGNIKRWIGNNTEIQKLKEEEKRKEDFLKMVSHELKTPVTSIKGYVQLLLSLLKGDQQVEFSKLPVKPSLERIDHQINRLTRLIAEMLDISRIEENKLNLEKTSFSINDLVDETVQDILFTNTHHLIEVQHKVQSSIFGDRDRIGQALINIITNAIKYSPERREVEIVVEASGNDKVAVIVRDEGIGIDPRKHKSIFQKFFRAGGKSEETYSGFGIGLYLANEIIQRHRGSIEVKSEIGRGAEFKILLASENKNKA